MKKNKLLLNSIFIKFPLIILLITIFLGTLSTFLTNHVTNIKFKKDIEEETSILLTNLNWAISPLLEKGEIEAIQRLIENTGVYDFIKSIRLYDTHYRIISSNKIEEIGKIKIEKTLKEILEGRKIKSVFGNFRKNEFITSIPVRGIKYDVKRKNDIEAVLFLGANLDYKKGILYTYRLSLILQNILIFFILTALFILFIYRMVFVPLGKFMEAAHEVSEGNYNYRIIYRKSDEFGKFSKLFNKMLDEISKKNEMLKSYSRQLEEKVKKRTKSLEEAKNKLEDSYKMLELKQREFIQAQKMEAVGRLAGGIAHDFNNILTVIIGYSDLLLMKIKNDDSLYSIITDIKKAGERAASLTYQLLAFSRRQILQPKVIDLNELILNIKKMLKHLIGEDIELITSLTSELGNVKADPGQIEQIVMNLVVNARDALPKGGKLIIETLNVYLDNKYISNHKTVQPGSYVMFAVSDNGIGMDEETKLHIFDPFYTTKEVNKGTGLGLSTVYGIVKQSGGYIWVYSELNEGTTFKIYLPLIEEESKLKKPKNIQARLLRGKETILLVEDDEMVKKLAFDTLIQYGYTVIEAQNPKEASIICERYKDVINLLVTDIIMPEMNGYDFARKIISLYPEIKILFVSGYTEDVIFQRGVLDMDSNFLQKPFTSSSFALTVREILDSSNKEKS